VLLQLIAKLSGQNIVVPLIILLSINSLIWYLKSGISSRLKQSLCPYVIIRLWVGGGSMTRLKFLTASCFCILVVFCAFAAEEPFRIRSVSTVQPGRVSVVVELPSGLTPKPDEFELLIDNKPVATVREIRGLDLN